MLKLAIALVCIASTHAYAGDFCGPLDPDQTIAALEKHADGKRTADDIRFDCIEQGRVEGAAQIAKDKRIVAACIKAVDLPEKKRHENVDGHCVSLVAVNGHATVGSRDIVAELMKNPGDWNLYPSYESMAATGDARVRDWLLAQYAKHKATWVKKKLKASWAKDLWLKHQLAVVKALEKVGTKDDLALVADVEATWKKDKRIKTAVAKTREAIGKR